MNWMIVLLAVLPMLLMALASWKRGDLTSSQMRRNGLDGHSLSSHWGWWSDLTFMPFIVEIIWRYHSQWSMHSIALWSSVSLIITAVAHYIWVQQNPADHNVIPKVGLTVAGKLHFLYMWVTLTFAFLLYTSTATISIVHMYVLAALLGSHVMATTIGLEWHRLRKVQGSTVFWNVVTWIGLLATARHKGQ